MGRYLVGLVVTAHLLAATIFLAAAPAAACSCLEPDPSVTLTTATAAFVGTAVEVLDDGSDGDEHDRKAIVRFEVETVIKGDVAESAVLFVKADEDSCGAPRFLPGQRGSLFGVRATITVYSPTAPTLAEGCTDLGPDAFLGVAAEPLPPPLGSHAHTVELGEWSGTSLRLLDAEGQPVAYVESTGVRPGGSVCKDGTSIVQVALLDGTPSMVWRDVATLNITVSRDLRDLPALEYIFDCAAGGRVLAWVGDQQIVVIDPYGETAEMAIEPGRPSLSPDGSLITIERGGEVAIYSIDEQRQLGVISDLPVDRIYGAAVSPGSTRVVVGTHDERSRLTITSTDGTVIETIDPPGVDHGALWWVDDATVAVHTGAIHMFDVAGAEPSHVGAIGPTGRVRHHAGSMVVVDAEVEGENAARFEVINLETGAATATIPSTRGRSHPLALAEVTEFVGSSYVPDSNRSLLSGARLPSTIHELGSMIELPDGHGPVYPVVTPTAGESPGFPGGTNRTESTTWILVVGGLALAAAAGAVAFRVRRSRTAAANDTQKPRATETSP